MAATMDSLAVNAIGPASQVQPLTTADEPSLAALLETIPMNIEDAPLKSWDAGLFGQELVALDIAPITKNVADTSEPAESEANEGQIKEGTWGGTQVAVTEIYDRIGQSYFAYFSATGIETPIPQVISDRAKLFKWSDPSDDNYPPHFEMPRSGGIPSEYDAKQYEIFNLLGLANAASMIVKIVPDTFLGGASQKLWSLGHAFINGRKDTGLSMKTLEDNNKSKWGRKTATDLMQGQNIGDLDDWWSDAKFAQQQFTGTNPTTITQASPEWIERFKTEAQEQRRNFPDALDFIAKAEPKSLYVQDCSYFREAVKAAVGEELRSDDRYCCAAVTLFHLPNSGQLHPIAIIVDWKGSMAKSVTLFNKRMTPLQPYAWDYQKKLAVEKTDWPWRYAKTCSQVSDWLRHELTIHLVNTHLVEEVIIVAANRVFGVENPVFKLLEPHWYRTLPLNAAARDVLVPKIIFDLIGLKGDQAVNFVNHAYRNFNFTGLYIPNDLPSRGFPLDDLSKEKFRNYPYAKNMAAMWNVLKNFVTSMLDVSEEYSSDAKIAAHPAIRSWCLEVQEKGQLPSFPTIRTKEDLASAITMCIHIASPQHTAVNYLQNFYMGFIPSKPPALYKPVPASITEALGIKEADLLAALPVGQQRAWLLATQIPWLLSFKTADNTSLPQYAKSLYSLVRKKSGAESVATKACATKLWDNLRDLVGEFKQNSDMMTKDTIPYIVMQPASTAVSILI